MRIDTSDFEESDTMPEENSEASLKEAISRKEEIPGVGGWLFAKFLCSTLFSTFLISRVTAITFTDLLIILRTIFD